MNTSGIAKKAARAAEIHATSFFLRRNSHDLLTLRSAFEFVVHAFAHMARSMLCSSPTFNTNHNQPEKAMTTAIAPNNQRHAMSAGSVAVNSLAARSLTRVASAAASQQPSRSFVSVLLKALSTFGA